MSHPVFPALGTLLDRELAFFRDEHPRFRRRELGQGLLPLPDAGGTRLLSRNRIKVAPSVAARLGMAIMTPGSWVLERKMLLGIKQRAELFESDSLATQA